VVGWLLAILGEGLEEFNNLERAIDQTKKGIELTWRGRDVELSSSRVGWMS